MIQVSVSASFIYSELVFYCCLFKVALWMRSVELHRQLWFSTENTNGKELGSTFSGNVLFSRKLRKIMVVMRMMVSLAHPTGVGLELFRICAYFSIANILKSDVQNVSLKFHIYRGKPFGRHGKSSRKFGMYSGVFFFGIPNKRQL